jgi:hypothetical protein
MSRFRATPLRLVSVTLVVVWASFVPLSAQLAPPPVLSTVPTPAEGARSEPAQMSGYPLQVGDLPPGILAVRLIRESFQQNLAGQSIEVRVITSGRVRSAATNTEGRAEFDGLSVGDRVQVRAIVGAEQLDSQTFAMPTQGGVRMVLVAGVGAGSPPSGAWPVVSDADAPVSAWPTPSAISAGAPVRPPSSSANGGFITMWGGGLIAAFAGLCLFVGLRKRHRPRASTAPRRQEYASSPARVPSPPPMPARAGRASVFEELVALEKSHQAGAGDRDAYQATREALVEALIAIDTPGASAN